MHAWLDVAVLAKTRNLNGRFVARAAAGLPFLLEEGDEVAFVPPQLDVPRRATVADVAPIDDRTAEVSFAEVDGKAAGVLVGSHCLIRRASVDESALHASPAIWEGWAVVDEAFGEVGFVTGFIENPGQMLLQVGRPDGREALVPIVDEIVRDVDERAGVVHVCLPQGLLDL